MDRSNIVNGQWHKMGKRIQTNSIYFLSLLQKKKKKLDNTSFTNKVNKNNYRSSDNYSSNNFSMFRYNILYISNQRNLKI